MCIKCACSQICDRICEKGPLGLRLDFELGIWSESTLDELSVAFYGASLAATVFEIRWLELRNYANHNMKKTAFESLLPVKPTTFRILPCY